MLIIPSIACFTFYLLLLAIPSFKSKCIYYFNNFEKSLYQKKDLTLFIVLIIYLCLTLLLQLNHPIDGDESQAWLIARDTTSFREMYSLMGYEGSPALWHTLLRPFAKSGIPPFGFIYILNHFFIIVAIIIWLWRAPLPLLIRILLPFTHLFLTEYAINARSYALSICLLFSALSLYKEKHSKWLLWSFLFFLLANTNIHSTMLSCGFTLFLLLNWLLYKRTNDLKAALLIGVGIVLAIVQVYPPSDLQENLASIVLQASLQNLTASVLPGHSILSMVVYFFLLIYVTINLDKKTVKISLLATQAALFTFFLFKYPGEMRHHFFLFLSLILSLWIAPVKERCKTETWLFIFGAIMVMVIASIPISIRKLQPGTNHKKEVTTFIKHEINPDTTTFISCIPDNLAVSFIPNLPIRQFYFPETEQWGSYIIWNQKRETKRFDFSNTRNIAALVKNNPGFKSYYYLSIERIPVDSATHYGIVLMKQSTDNRLLQISHPWNTIYFYKLAGENEKKGH